MKTTYKLIRHVEDSEEVILESEDYEYVDAYYRWYEDHAPDFTYAWYEFVWAKE